MTSENIISSNKKKIACMLFNTIIILTMSFILTIFSGCTQTPKLWTVNEFWQAYRQTNANSDLSKKKCYFPDIQVNYEDNNGNFSCPIKNDSGYTATMTGAIDKSNNVVYMKIDVSASSKSNPEDVLFVLAPYVQIFHLGLRNDEVVSYVKALEEKSELADGTYLLSSNSNITDNGCSYTLEIKATTYTPTETITTTATSTKETAVIATENVIKISAANLVIEYNNNEIDANKKYKDNKVYVTGEISDIGVISGQTYIILSNEDTIGVSGVLCFFVDLGEIDTVGRLIKGQTISVQGTVIGKADYVEIYDCYIKAYINS